MFKIKTIEFKPMVSKKTGKPYKQLIVTTEDGRRATGFGGKENEHWKAGDVIQDIEAVIVQDGKWYNIKMVEGAKATGAGSEILKRLDVMDQKLDELNTKMLSILNKLDGSEIPI